MSKLRKLMTESKYLKREFGEPLPTLKGVMKKHQVNKLKEDWWSDMSSGEQADYIKRHPGSSKAQKAQDKQRNNLSLFTKRLLEKYEIKASTTDITKLLITEIWDTGSTQDKIRFAMWRGHEVQTAARTYATAL